VALSRRTGRSRFTLLLLVLTSITVITLDFRGSGFIGDIRSVAGSVFSPVRDGAETVFEPVTNIWNGIFDYGDVKDENEALQRRIEELEGDLVASGDAARQLEELSQLAGLPITSQLPSVAARVVSGPLSNFEHTIEINRGSDSGVREGMPVVTGAGLVGRVVQASGSRARVELLTDPGFEVGIRLVTSGDVGVAHGDGRDNPLVVDTGIDPNNVVPQGEAVTTSGHDRSIFPPDLPIGMVVSVRHLEDQLGQELQVEPLADLHDLSYVNVLLWEPPA
jgi:rod shape-determining protein MreC